MEDFGLKMASTMVSLADEENSPRQFTTRNLGTKSSLLTFSSFLSTYSFSLSLLLLLPIVSIKGMTILAVNLTSTKKIDLSDTLGESHVIVPKEAFEGNGKKSSQ
jgi:hypothetical protein